jgi:ParB family chromosome partitioning protein
MDAWRRMVADDLTVRQAEEIAKALKMVHERFPASSAIDHRDATPPDPHLRSIEDGLRQHLGAKVALTRNRNGRGRITISFHSDEELEGILGVLGIRQ